MWVMRSDCEMSIRIGAKGGMWTMVEGFERWLWMVLVDVAAWGNVHAYDMTIERESNVGGDRIDPNGTGHVQMCIQQI